MAVREIAHLGHPVLRKPAIEVDPEEIKTEKFQAFLNDLVETMRDANGAGLAAPQIFESIRVCALEVHKNPRYPYKPDIPLTILINPKIEVLSEETFGNYEGCLSVPNLRGMVQRHAHIRVTALDRNGDPVSIDASGITAGTYQHEVDHLDALLFVDRVENSQTLTTWTQFDEHYKDEWFETAQAIVDKYGS